MKIVMFGTEQNADIIDHYFTHDSDFEVAAFTVDGDYVTEDTHNGRPVVAFEEVLEAFPPDEYYAFAAMGFQKMNALRAEKFAAFEAKGYRFASYLSSKASAYKGFVPGRNTCIMEHNTIQPFVTVGENVTMWSGNHIGHHSTIGDHCFISSHVVVSGRVTVGASSFLGVNSTIRDGISLGEATMVGAGCLILKDGPEKGVYMAERTEPRRITSDRLRSI